MADFQYYQDVKITVWERKPFMVCAQSQEEADRIAASCTDSIYDIEDCGSRPCRRMTPFTKRLRSCPSMKMEDQPPSRYSPEITDSLQITVKTSSHEARNQTERQNDPAVGRASSDDLQKYCRPKLLGAEVSRLYRALGPVPGLRAGSRRVMDRRADGGSGRDRHSQKGGQP